MRRFVPVVLAALLLGAAVSHGQSADSVQVSIDESGGALSGGSGSTTAPPAISSDGSIVAFESTSPAAGDDTNGLSDIFVRLLDTEATGLVSAGLDGRAANNLSTNPSISGDGNLVAFQSFATDLVPGDANGLTDIFVRDRSAGTTTRVGPAGTDPNGASSVPSLSRDGRWVAYCSTATNLVPGDDNGLADAFLAPLGGGDIVRLTPANGATGACTRTAISDDGSVVVFSALVEDDGDRVGQVYRHVVGSGETSLVSSSGGSPGNGGSGLLGLATSGDGATVAFESAASDLVDGDDNDATDAFAWTETDGIQRVSETQDGTAGNHASGGLGVAVSGDGAWVAFGSEADNLLVGDINSAADVFRVELSTSAVSLVSADIAGRSANGPSYTPSINRDGGAVAFASLAANVAFGDRNKDPDVFRRTGSFPSTAGPEGATPIGTAGPALESPISSDDDGGIPTPVVIGLVALALIATLGAGWYWLGRRPQA